MTRPRARLTVGVIGVLLALALFIWLTGCHDGDAIYPDGVTWTGLGGRCDGAGRVQFRGTLYCCAREAWRVCPVEPPADDDDERGP